MTVLSRFSLIASNTGKLGMIVRRAEKQDNDEWARLKNDFTPDHRSQHQHDTQQYFMGFDTDIIDVFVLDKGYGKLGGFIELNIRSFAEGSRATAVPYVEAWYVEPALRHLGYGKELMRTAESWAKQMGYRELASDSRLENEASIASHKALGFDEVQRIVCFIKKL